MNFRLLSCLSFLSYYFFFFLKIVVSSDLFSSNHELQRTGDNVSEHNKQQHFDVLELNISKILVTNTRVELTSSRNKLEQNLKLFKQTEFFSTNSMVIFK